MSEKRVLIVEDEEVTMEMLNEIISAGGYDVTTATNGEEALEYYKENPFMVIMTDIKMPKMDGNELIKNIKEINEQTIIIVQTAHSDLNTVIKTMRKGVFDYIIKPISPNDILLKLERAFEIAELRKMKTIMEKEKFIKLESQLEWLKWNEHFIKRDYDRVDKTLFKSLHTSFNQGAGFGAVLTLLNIISTTAKREGDSYLINSKLFDMINQSAKLAEKAINTFSDISNIMLTDLNLDKISIADFYKIIKEVINKASEFKKIDGHNILLSDKKNIFSEKFVKIDEGKIKKAILELMINAFKFSKKNTKIIVILDFEDDKVVLSIINDPKKFQAGINGIPQEYETIIFEPFFRIDSNVFEEYDTLDYGLGLVLVDKIIDKHNATISASNIKDFTDISTNPVLKVNFKVSFPLEN